ncbi:MAG TPA: hypothetical protein VF713_27540 [Thermoanaerobaculia bacterium]
MRMFIVNSRKRLKKQELSKSCGPAVKSEGLTLAGSAWVPRGSTPQSMTLSDPFDDVTEGSLAVNERSRPVNDRSGAVNERSRPVNDRSGAVNERSGAVGERSVEVNDVIDDVGIHQ